MLLEAVPNLSLGPESDSLDAVLTRLDAEQSPGWALLDVHSDPDHNRTVLSLAGAPCPLDRVLGALLDALLEEASLVGHEGVHPRIGMLDVLPFVRLSQAREHDVQRAARQATRRLARAGLPVFRYGRRADGTQHRSRAAIRRHVAWTGSADPLSLEPAAGPARFHATLGAACVGVRDPLVAYNVLLDTTDVDLGHRIAKALRPNNGGLAGVEALAFELASQGGRVQVSTNLTDVDTTTTADVYRFVEQAAADAGVAVLEGELVGLAPRRALPEDPADIGLPAPPETLEDRLAHHGFPSEVP